MITAKQARDLMVDLSGFYKDLDLAIAEAAVAKKSSIEFQLSGKQEYTEIEQTLTKYNELIRAYLTSLGYFVNWEGMQFLVIYWDGPKVNKQ